MNIVKRKNSKGDKIFFFKDYGREKGQRAATDRFYELSKWNIERF